MYSYNFLEANSLIPLSNRLPIIFPRPMFGEHRHPSVTLGVGRWWWEAFGAGELHWPGQFVSSRGVDGEKVVDIYH